MVYGCIELKGMEIFFFWRMNGYWMYFKDLRLCLDIMEG